jgi:hypothetical protein
MATSGVINLVDRVAGENAIKRSVHRNLAGSVLRLEEKLAATMVVSVPELKVMF